MGAYGLRTRVYGLGRNSHHHYPSYAPKVILHRVRHWAIGPLLGCSCSTCFRSRWRIMWSNQIIDRFVKNERKIRELQGELMDLKASLPKRNLVETSVARATEDNSRRSSGPPPATPPDMPSA